MLKVNWKLDTKLYRAGLRAAKLLQASGFQAFWVGGIVRNILLKRESDNIDIATDATPQQVEKILDTAKITNKPVGKQFGSILAIVDQFKIEITTFRSEGRYSDNRHPDQVEFIKGYLQDAKRRDFTINALYFDPLTNVVYDPTNGLKDLKAELLRFVGDPKKRIDEDGLRMLRGVRLATQLGFKLEKNSFAAIKTRAKYIQDISGERIKAELDKILVSGRPAEGIRLLDQTGLLRFIIPEVEGIKEFSHKSKNYHLEGSILDHTLIAVHKAKRENVLLIYALLFHDIGKPQKAQKVLKDEGWVISTKGHADVGANIFAEFAEKMKFSKDERHTIEWLIRNHMHHFDFTTLGDEKQIQLASEAAFPLLLKHWHSDEAATKRKQHRDDHHSKYLKSLKLGKKLLTRIARTKLLVAELAKGGLIMEYSNLKPGPGLGAKIEQIKILIILGKIKSEADLRRYLRN